MRTGAVADALEENETELMMTPAIEPVMESAEEITETETEEVVDPSEENNYPRLMLVVCKRKNYN